MDFSSIPLFSVMKTKLNYGSARQGVLAQNIANADTPDYRAKDVIPPDFKQILARAANPQVQKLRMTATEPGHIQNSDKAQGFNIEKRKTTDELNPIGNNVVIEEEMMKVAQNQSEYQKTLSLYRKMITMFRTAVGGQGGNA